MSENKTDAKLGKRVHEHLTKVGVETPMIETSLSDGQKVSLITEKMSDVLTALGLDLSDDSLSETPLRVAKMFVNEIYSGLSYDRFPKCTTVENKMGYNEMVIEKDITVYSDCEHHLRTIFGTAHVAYIPSHKVLGLSKIPRIVKFFARRPQIQERLTEQIYHALECILETDNIAVVIDAKHMCVSQRGVEDTSAHTITSKLGGGFLSNSSLRSEFMTLIRSK
jgi:GTP cyclohydrolase IA